MSSVKVALQNQIFVIFFILQSSCAVSSSSITPTSAVEICRLQNGNTQKQATLFTLEGTVGFGWDNLRNEPMAAVLNSTYAKCRLTPDGQYLIADGMEALMVKRSRLDRIARFYDHYQEYMRDSKETINVDASFGIKYFSISGSYSSTHEENKKTFYSEDTSLYRTNLVYHAYTVISQPGTPLHETFKRRLLEIAAHLSKRQMRTARYLAEMTIRDFGTHLIVQADVGAVVTAEDFVDKKLDKSSKATSDEKKKAASGSFFNIFKISGSQTTSVKTEAKEEYGNAVRQSQIRCRGGLAMEQIMSTGDNGNNKSQGFILGDDVITLDRSGVPLFIAISEDNLPELPPQSIIQIKMLLKNATEAYYKRNVRFGCTDPEATNYDFQVNIEDNSCNMPYHNLTFGGVYQTCVALPDHPAYPAWDPSICNNRVQKNTATADYSCPEPYRAVKIFSVTERFSDVVEHRHHHHWWCWFNRDWCRYDVWHVRRAEISFYWCNATAALNVSENEGFLFGGLFRNGQMNPFTGRHGCSGNYHPYFFGYDVTICLSRDYEVDSEHSVAFGGFFSCETPSALAKCPKGYSQHLATMLENCDVFYCARKNALRFFKTPIVYRPPYDDLAAILDENGQSMIYGYDNQSQLVYSKPVRDVLNEFFLKNQAKFNVGSTTTEQPATDKGETENDAIDQWLSSLHETTAALGGGQSVNANETIRNRQAK